MLESAAVTEARKRIRLAEENYLGWRACFITLCCHDRLPFFRDAGRATALINHLRGLSAQMAFWVHAYCVMPDHVHILVEGQRAECNLVRFVQKLKMVSAFAERKRSGRQLWQRSFYDHIVRPRESHESIAWYIWMNPVRKGYVAEPERYPFSGSLTCEWKQSPKPAFPWTPPWHASAGKQSKSGSM